MNKLPIRLRLTAAFVVAMAAVLSAVGAFVYFRLASSLTEGIDEGLDARAALLGGADTVPRSSDDESVTQIVSPDGVVLSGDPPPLLRQEDRARAERGPVRVERDDVRLLATPEEGRLVVVGTSLEDRDEALDGLVAQLLVGVPFALLLAGVAGYALAGAALRPVEAMRRRAEEISAATPEARLPLPPARDEISRLGTTLNAMLERLDAGLRRERRFVADASHELRTPLALLRAELELALRRRRTPEEVEQTLRSALEEVDRLTRLAEDLLVLAAAEDGRLPLRREPLAARQLLEGVAGRFAARAVGDGRSLAVAAPADLHVDGDLLRLEQAVGNLVDNALRHGAGAIRLDAKRRNGAVEIRVSDNGAGFATSFLPRAFERFSRADESRARGGAGLGLAIVEAIARAHGGSARADNDAGGGATVTLSLPAE